MKSQRTRIGGISTQRAAQYFQISGRRFPVSFIRALAEVKKACVKAKLQLGNIDEKKSRAILTTIEEMLEGKQRALDAFQTGSGTQFNINMNEVRAR